MPNTSGYIAFIDYARSMALFGMIIYHARVLQILPEQCWVESGTSVHPSSVMECIGSFARNTFIFLIGVSLVLSSSSAIRKHRNSESAKEKKTAFTTSWFFLKNKLKRAANVGLCAFVMTLASKYFMGNHRMIRWGVLHFATVMIILGAIVCSLCIFFFLTRTKRVQNTIESYASTLVTPLFLWAIYAVFQPVPVPHYEFGTERSSLMDLAFGKRLGRLDLCAIDYFNVRKWATLVILGAFVSLAVLPSFEKLRGKVFMGTRQDETVRKLSKYGLELYVGHFVTFLALYKLCVVSGAT